MKTYSTKIRAVYWKDRELHTYSGPNVPGISFKDAQNYCETNGLGYCEVDGELVSEIPCKPGTVEPDWDNRKDYDTQQLN